MIVTIINPHASYYLGGTEVVTLNQARSLAQRGHSVRYITIKTDSTSDYYRAFRKDASTLPIEIYEIELPMNTPLADGTWSRYYQLSCLFGVAANETYQKLSDSSIFITHLSADSLFLPLEAKNILHLHGNPRQTDAVIDAALSRVSHCIAQASTIKDWWQTNYPHVYMQVFRNGINTVEYNGKPEIHRSIDILYVGRFLEHKGIDDILNAAPRNAKITIAGHGPYLSELRKLAAKLKHRNVTFHDSPSTSKIRQLYKDAKLFACPSRSKEGVLTTMLEAASSGCCIITASGSGMTDLAIDKYNSRVVAPGDINQLSRIFNELLTDSSERHKLAGKIQQEVTSRWSWESKGQELEELYEQAFSTR